MNNRAKHTDQELADRIAARVHLKDDVLHEAEGTFMDLMSRVEGISALLRNCREEEDQYGPLDRYHCEGLGAVIQDAVKGMYQQLDIVQDRYEDLLYDAKQRASKAGARPDTMGDDAPDPLSAAAVEVAQQFDTFDAEQQDTIRRVMREFPV